MTRERYLELRNGMEEEAQTLISEGKVDEATVKMAEIEKLDNDFEGIARAQANLKALQGGVIGANLNNKNVEIIEGKVVDNMGNNGKEDIYASDEYSKAFMNFVCRGTSIPDKFKNEAGPTTTTDTSAVIPTTILQELIKEMKTYGSIWNKVRKISMKGGVEVPILTLKPKATWIGETAPSGDQKIKADKKVSFSYYGLECKISQSLLASVVTLEMFQQQFVPLAAESIIEAAEKAIISGDGEGKFLGITNDTRVPIENIITLTDEDMNSYKGWKQKVFAKMKKAYRAGEFVMAQGTFDTYIDGMVDKSGQPIGRVNYGIEGSETYRFGGKTVETVEDDIIVPYDEAAEGDVIGIFINWKDYAVNTNMEMTTTKWTDNDTNEIKNKCILIADGKLIDTHGVLILKKGAANSDISAITIGSLTLEPSFSPDITEYTASTANDSNKITISPDGDIKVNGSDFENGQSATWQSGQNIVTITRGQKTYKVTVTKS